MNVIEVNRRLKPSKSRFGRHSRKRKTPLSRGGFVDGQKSRTVWNYDIHGRLAQIDDNGKLVTYKYNSKNQLAEQIINGIPVHYTYTQFGQLEGKYMGSKERPIAFLKYTYDNDGMITARNVNGANQLYTYDLKGQLTSVTQDGKVVESYTYDPAGNILKKVVQGKTTELVYDAANQLVSMTENSGEAGNNAVRRTDFAYDAAGRMTQQIHGEAGTDALRRTEYAYGWMNKVMSISENVKVSATYDYHIDGQVAKRLGSDGKAQNFFWDGLALIRRGETNLTNEPYVTGGNPIISGEKALFNDILGTTQGATDGKEFSQISRDSFGQTLDNSTDTNYDYFTGKPKVEGLGYAFLFRNYAAGLGKWTTSDPLGYPDGWNNFAYVNNGVTRCFDWQGTVIGDGIWEWESAGPPDDQRPTLSNEHIVETSGGYTYETFITKYWSSAGSWTIGNAYTGESKSYGISYTLGVSGGFDIGISISLEGSVTKTYTVTFSTSAGRKAQFDMYEEKRNYAIYKKDSSGNIVDSWNFNGVGTGNFGRIITGWNWEE